MINFLKRLLGKGLEQIEQPKREFSDEENEQFYTAKEAALENILGKMYGLVGHAIIPFQIGGAVDMYYFPNACDGTALVTMELIEPDGTGPKPNRMGTYELIAFTKHKIDPNNKDSDFEKIERRICGIFTSIGNFSYQAKLEPGETCEIPQDEGENTCLLFDEYKVPGYEFIINGRKHGLLICIEIFPTEMYYAMEHGSQELLTLLKEANYYPFSDLDRNPVV